MRNQRSRRPSRMVALVFLCAFHVLLSAFSANSSYSSPTWMAHGMADRLLECNLCTYNDYSPFDPNAQIIWQNVIMTCLELYLRGPLLLNSCTTLSLIGQTACDCQPGTPPPANMCTLCEDGSALPTPSKTSLHGRTCSAMQTTSRQDNVNACPKYQGVLGTYCGCSNPITTKSICPVCGRNSVTGKNRLLPRPQQVMSNGVTCLEYEFFSSLSGSCAASQQSSFAKQCCATQSTSAQASPGLGYLFTCFSKQTTVQVKRSHHPAGAIGDATTSQVVETIPIHHVKVGDEIQDGPHSFSRVYSWSHYDDEETGLYLQIYTSKSTTTTTPSKPPSTLLAQTSSPLEVSMHHLVFTSSGKAVPAGMLKVGDTLLHHDNDDNNYKDDAVLTIVKIDQVHRQGVYAPFTESGKIMVNKEQIMASAFVSLDYQVSTTNNDNDDANDGDTIIIHDTILGGIMSWHTLGFMSQSPHRLYCRYISACEHHDDDDDSQTRTTLTTSTDAGTPTSLSPWVAGQFQLAVWIFTSNSILLRMVVLIPVVIFFTCCTGVEWLLSLLLQSHVSMMIMMLIVSMVSYHYGSSTPSSSQQQRCNVGTKVLLKKRKQV